jgi:hypothetical protein
MPSRLCHQFYPEDKAVLLRPSTIKENYERRRSMAVKILTVSEPDPQ